MAFVQACKLEKPIPLGSEPSSFDPVVGAYTNGPYHLSHDSMQVSWYCGLHPMACPFAE